MVLWDLIVLVPLGLLAGGLAGLLGIGGGLIFSPLLLWIGFSPHEALATSTFAIVPTALSGTLTHLFARGLPIRAGLSIGVAAFLSALLFSRVGPFVSGWQLLMLQVMLYLVLAATIRSDHG
ncbi:MAG: TSUP family transporter, partial [Prochlorococcus sp.]